MQTVRDFPFFQKPTAQMLESMNEERLFLLKLFARPMSENEFALLKKAMLDFQIERMHEAVDKAWEERGYTQETMDGWLKEHMRTPYGPEKKVESAS